MTEEKKTIRKREIKSFNLRQFKEEVEKLTYTKNSLLIKPFSRFGKINSQTITRYTVNFNDFEQKVIFRSNQT